MRLEDLDDAAFRRFLHDTRPGPETLAQARARLDGRADTLGVPAGCAIEPADIAGVATERLTPATARPGRTLIYLHGGGYQVGSPRSHRFLAARLAETAACEAVVPDYRKAPEAPFPGAVEDAVAVYRAALRADPAARIVVGGDSAGAGLALALALSAKAQGLPQPAGLLLISPWTDLTHQGSTYDIAGDTVTLTGLKDFARDYAAGADLRDPLISPVFADLGGLPPLLVQVGSGEKLLSDSTRLAERAAAADVEVTLHVIPRLVHGFSAHFPRLASVRRAMAEAGGWVGERLA